MTVSSLRSLIYTYHRINVRVEWGFSLENTISLARKRIATQYLNSRHQQIHNIKINRFDLLKGLIYVLSYISIITLWDISLRLMELNVMFIVMTTFQGATIEYPLLSKLVDNDHNPYPKPNPNPNQPKLF